MEAEIPWGLPICCGLGCWAQGKGAMTSPPLAKTPHFHFALALQILWPVYTVNWARGEILSKGKGELYSYCHEGRTSLLRTLWVWEARYSTLRDTAYTPFLGDYTHYQGALHTEGDAMGRDAVWNGWLASAGESPHRPLGFWSREVLYLIQKQPRCPSAPGRNKAPDHGALPSGTPELLSGNHMTV